MPSSSTRPHRRRALSSAALAALLAAALATALATGLTACGAEEESPDTATVVTGTVIEGATPAEGAEVVLLGWPAAATDAVRLTGGGQAPARDLDVLGRAVADEEGRFTMEADLEELTARAASDGVVDVRLQVEGDDGSAVPATVRLERDLGTGVTEVTPHDDLVLRLSP